MSDFFLPISGLERLQLPEAYRMLRLDQVDLGILSLVDWKLVQTAGSRIPFNLCVRGMWHGRSIYPHHLVFASAKWNQDQLSSLIESLVLKQYETTQALLQAVRFRKHTSPLSGLKMDVRRANLPFFIEDAWSNQETLRDLTLDQPPSETSPDLSILPDPTTKKLSDLDDIFSL